jgi:hypothetical protein
MSVCVQPVELLGGDRTWTVLGADHRQVGPLEEFLEYHRVTGSSPHTVRAYAKALQLWWRYLGLDGRDGAEADVPALAGFVTWLREGTAPGVVLLDPAAAGPPRLAESTLATRLAAVVSFYRYHHDAHGVARAWSGPPRRSRYRAFLAHLDGRSRASRRSPMPLRRRRREACPLLTPAQVWDPRHDRRIPVREHEPLEGQRLNFARVSPAWLREAIQWYFATRLSTGLLSWSSLPGFLSYLDRHLAAFLAAEGIDTPVLHVDPEAGIRPVALRLAGWLRQQRTRSGRPLAPSTVGLTQTTVAGFYAFMADRRGEAARDLGEPDQPEPPMATVTRAVITDAAGYQWEMRSGKAGPARRVPRWRRWWWKRHGDL